MKKLIMALGFCTLASNAHAAIAFVQSASTNTATSAVSTSTAFGFANTTAGNAILVCVDWGDTTKTMAITDNQSDVYTSTGSFTTNSGLDRYQIFWSTNIVGGQKTRVTATINSGTTNIDLAIHEYSGIATGSLTTSVYDVAATTFSIPAGTALTSGNLTTTNANDLGFACGYSANSVSTAQPGWNQRKKWNGNMTEDTLFTVTLTTAAKFTASSGAWSDAFVTFLPKSSSPSAGPSFIRGLYIEGGKTKIQVGKMALQ